METNITNIVENFLATTVQLTAPWLIVMLAIIILDLIFGLRKSKHFKEEVKISTAIRKTLNKTMGYFWFVVTVGLIEAAANLGFRIATWGCLIVCAIELSSVIYNFLKIKGYKFNKEKGFDFIVRKTMKRIGVDDLEKGELSSLIEKDEESTTQTEKGG